ncbi:hypothetical protein [Capnocytophaga canis]|nr:hypothetical protein [Capnocytophaga canis]
MFKRFREAARNVASRVRGAVPRVLGRKKNKDADLSKAKGGRG